MAEQRKPKINVKWVINYLIIDACRVEFIDLMMEHFLNNKKIYVFGFLVSNTG